MRGLSPRTRGKLLVALDARRSEGPIPADAGETSRGSPSRVTCRAYPRGRGGNINCVVWSRTEGGLSPRTRGKRGGSQVQGRPRGPIPADAGETAGKAGRGALTGAYPRGRGGNDDHRAGGYIHRGLSPRTRGKPERQAAYRARRGPIPADAGETFPVGARRDLSAAYPRGRGGNQAGSRIWSMNGGLSPRTRGKHRRPVAPHANGGPIPADAGETN